MKTHSIIAGCLSIAAAAYAVTTDAQPSLQSIQTKLLVNKAAEYVKQKGIVEAVCAFNQKGTGYNHGEYYIYGWTCGYPDPMDNNIAVAGAIDPGVKIFTNFSKYPVMAKLNAALLKHPNGAWLSYPWVNFTNNKKMLKHAYAVKLPKYHLCLGSGYYTKLGPT